MLNRLRRGETVAVAILNVAGCRAIWGRDEADFGADWPRSGLVLNGQVGYLTESTAAHRSHFTGNLFAQFIVASEGPQMQRQQRESRRTGRTIPVAADVISTAIPGPGMLLSPINCCFFTSLNREISRLQPETYQKTSRS